MVLRPRKGFPLPASVCVCALACAAPLVHAHTPPDAGSMLSESECTLRADIPAPSSSTGMPPMENLDVRPDSIRLPEE